MCGSAANYLRLRRFFTHRLQEKSIHLWRVLLECPLSTAEVLESTGCQPVGFGSLPKQSLSSSLVI
jgi:hypothetical protein